MKNLMAGAALAVALIFHPAVSRADLPVIDSASLIGQAKSLFQDLKGYAVQLQQLQHEISSDINLAMTAASLIQNPNLGAVMGLMNMVGIENPLPINPYAVQGLVSGYGGGAGIGSLVGRLNGLGGLVTTSYSTDHIYSCTDQSFSCQTLTQRGYSNAGAKGLLSKLSQDMAAHVPVLQGLRQQLGLSTDPAQRENIMAQVAIENAWAQKAQGDVQMVLAMATQQRAVEETRQDEHLTQSINSFLAAVPK